MSRAMKVRVSFDIEVDMNEWAQDHQVWEVGKLRDSVKDFARSEVLAHFAGLGLKVYSTEEDV